MDDDVVRREIEAVKREIAGETNPVRLRELRSRLREMGG